MTKSEQQPITQKRLAFIVETIAHLNSNPAIQPYVRSLLLAATLLRKTTDAQMAAAIEEENRK